MSGKVGLLKWNKRRDSYVGSWDTWDSFSVSLETPPQENKALKTNAELSEELCKQAIDGDVEQLSQLLEWLKTENRLRDVIDESEDGVTAFHHAAMNSHYKIMETLFSFGADINKQDLYGMENAVIHYFAR